MSKNRKSDRLSEMQSKAVFDQGLSALAQSLEGAEQRKEAKLRRGLLAVKGRFSRDFYELARILSGYRETYKVQRQWTKFCQIIDVNVRTAHRLIQNFAMVRGLDPAVRRQAASRGLDLTQPKNRSIVRAILANGGSGSQEADQLPADVLNRALSQLTPQGKLLKPAKESTPCDRVYEYAKKLFEDVAPGKRKSELKRFYTKLNAYFALGAMTIPFVNSPALVSIQGGDN
jgi:hypothetical protein